MKVRRAITSQLSALAVLLVLTAIGCGDEDAPPSSAPDTEEPRGLVGVRWVASGFLDGASIEPPAEPGTVHFEENGFVAGSDGCNDFGYVASGDADDPAPDGLAYEIVGDEIRFTGSWISTLRGCSDTGYEGRIRHVLTGTVTYEIDGAKLTLTASDGAGVAFTDAP